MDQELRAILTAPRIGCTQEHIAAFEKEGILKASDVRLLTDPDFSAMHIGIATKNRVMAAMQQHAAGVGSEAPQRAPPVQTHIGDFTVSPTVSAPLRKLYAEYSREAVTSSLQQRGLKPTVRAVRQAVELVGGHWPWAGKSIDADVQVLRNARRALDAKEFDDVDTQVSPMPPPCPQHCPPLARLAHCCSRDAPKTLHCCSARTLRGSRVSSRHPELPPAICTLTCTTPHPTPDLTGRACIEAADAHWRIPWIPTVARGRGGSFGAVGRD